MTNPLIEHMRESGRRAGRNLLGDARRLLTRAFWRHARAQIRQGRAGRIALGLAVAFACGVGLGVGMAAMIAPELRGGPPRVAEAEAARPGRGGDPVVAVSVRAPEETVEAGAVAGAAPDTSAIATPPSDDDRPYRRPAPPSGSALPEESPGAGAPKAPMPPAAATRVQVPLAKASRPSAPPAPDTANTSSDGPADGLAARPADKSLQQSGYLRDPEPQDAPLGPTLTARTPDEPLPDAGSVASQASPAGMPAMQAAPVAQGPADLADRATDDAPGKAPDGSAPTADPAAITPPNTARKDLQLAALPMPLGDAWIRNAIPMPERPRDAMIALIIDDMGIDQKRSKQAILLPPPLTFSFIPYGYNLEKFVAAARKAGHEVMLHLPMEPLDTGVDPGPNALRTTVSMEENRHRLLWALSRFDGFVGLNNHMGSKFTTWRPGMELVMEVAQARGLLFVDSFTNNESLGYKLAQQHRIPSTGRDVFIDHDVTRDAIRNSLHELEQIARRRGYAVGIAHPHDLTRAALQSWIIDAKSRGFDFVPISYIVRRTMKSG